MNKCIIFAVIAFAAVASTNAGYLPQPYNVPVKTYGSPIYTVSAVSNSAAAAAATSSSSLSVPRYLIQVPSYVIDGGNPGYGINIPSYRNSYQPIY